MMTKIKWRKWNRVLHRDLGYFFFGMTFIYGLSGIALNHIDDWDPNYIIKTIEFSVEPADEVGIDKNYILDILADFGLEADYKKHYYPNPGSLKVFIKNGSMSLNTSTGEGSIETIKRRPLFYEVNFLHYNPSALWTWFSDIFAASLIIIALSGMLIVRGKNGIKRRGLLLGLAGIIIPIILLYLYI